MVIPDGISKSEGRWCSVDETAAHLGVATDTIYRWIDKRGLPAHRIGRLWKCKIAEVDAWVRKGGSAESAAAPRKSARGGRR
jgi:excisionase family DNA binding protein